MASKNFIHELKEGTRIACDVNISNVQIGRYARQGCVIVCVAKEGESDESWVSRAYKCGAEYCLSQDADVGIIIDREGYDEMHFLFEC